MASKNNKESAKSVPASVTNRKARHDYEFLSTYEAGIALQGSEVKSVFAGKVNMTDAYCEVKGNELYLVNLDIEPYKHAATAYVPERRRERKLLMHRKEIDLIARRAQEKGLAIVPFRVYFKNGRAKVEIALARGKKAYDKRDAIKKKDERRALQKGLDA
jgi:SsrA-binding protein